MPPRQKNIMETATSDFGRAHDHANKVLLDAMTELTLHSHANLALLDTITALNVHSHANQALLDTYAQTEADLADAVSKKHAAAHTHAEADVTNLATDLAAKEAVANKGAASGYASLDAGSKVVQNPTNATATPTASKIPIAGAGGTLDGGWVPSSLTDSESVECLAFLGL